MKSLSAYLLAGVAFVIFSSFTVAQEKSTIPAPLQKTSDWGPTQAGLRCRTTAVTKIEHNMSLEVSVEMQAVVAKRPPNIKQLNLFMPDEFMELILTHTKTGKTVCVRPYDPTGGMLAIDSGEYVAPLDGTKIKAWSISFPLVTVGEKLVPGRYDCRVGYSFPKKPSKYFWRGRQLPGKDAAWEAAGFWHGTVESAAVQLDIVQEVPKFKTVLLPKRLRLEQELKIHYAKDDAEAVELKLRNGHFLATRCIRNDNDKAASSSLGGEPPSPDGINPIDRIYGYKGGDLKISIDMEIFETADPPVHFWQPHPSSGGYKTLWKKTLTLSLTEKEIREKE